MWHKLFGLARCQGCQDGLFEKSAKYLLPLYVCILDHCIAGYHTGDLSDGIRPHLGAPSQVSSPLAHSSLGWGGIWAADMVFMLV